MSVYQLAVRLEGPKQLQELMRLFEEHHLPPDPWDEGLRIEPDAEGKDWLVVIATGAVRKELEEMGLTQRIERDFSEEPDPRQQVSRTNRFAEELERLRSEKKGD